MENITDRSQSIIVGSCIEYYSRVVGSITYQINNRCEAEDLAQDVFVHLVEYKQILCEVTVKYFIYAISRSIVTDYLRHYYKAREISNYLYDQTSFYTNETEETVLANDISLLERKKLLAFSRQRKQIYYLTHFEGLSSVEIATHLNVGKRVVECHLFMARKEMRTYLQQCI